ncbi:haloacid dehalogenase [Spirochaetia bacterium]|nr:haloacid dehalogenase [Spirochaetia bacterium]
MKKALIIDLEGTLVSSGIALSGSIDFINYIQENNIPYYIITNTISKTIEQMENSLNSIGFNVNKEYIINPIMVLNYFIKQNNVKTYYFIGPDYLKDLIIESNDFDIPEYVIFCDFERIDCNYTFLNKIFQYIKNGSKIITTSYSNYYISNKEYKLDIGIFVKMYEELSKEKAIILGKPSNMIYKMVMDKIKMNAEEIITIGDDGLTDIMGGKEVGIETTLVKTGKYKTGDENIYKPDNIIENIKDAIKYFQ